MTTGIPGLIPRFPEPGPPIQQGYFQNAPMNLIRIDRSTVGWINTGQVERIEASVNLIQQQGGAELGERLARFAESVGRDAALSTEAKQEVFERLDFISTQLASRQARKSVVGPVADAIGLAVQTSAALVALWNEVFPLIARAFGA